MTELANLEKHSGVAHIHMDDGKANAFSHDMLDRIHALLDQAEADDDVGAVVISGRTGRFSGGFHLPTMQESPEAGRRLVGRGGELALRTAMFPKPVVIACTGHAIAMAAIWLCAVDYRIGARGDFRIGMNEVALGMVMTDFGDRLGKAVLSPRFYHRAIVLGEVFDADGARDAGFLDEAVEPEQLIERALEKARQLMDYMNLPAHVESKRRFRGPLIESIRSAMDDNLRDLLEG